MSGEPERKPRGRHRKHRWPEPIDADPEDIMRALVRTPRKLVERELDNQDVIRDTELDDQQDEGTSNPP